MSYMFLRILVALVSCFAGCNAEIWDMTWNAVPTTDYVNITPRAPIQFFDTTPDVIWVSAN